MSKPTRFTAICLLLAFAVLFLAGAATADDTKDDTKAKAEAKERMKLEKKAEEAEKLRQKKEEAERVKREEAELARQKAEARAAAKAEEERLAQVDAEAKAQAQAEIAEARDQMMAKMAELDAKAAQQTADAKARLEQLKSDYEMKKSALNAEYKEKIAAAEGEQKASLETECKSKQLNLSEKYKSDVASVKQLQAEQKAEISQQKTVIENEYDEKVAIANAKARRTLAEAKMASINLPQDNTPKMTVRRVRLSGNILVTTAQVIDNMPLIWSASGEPISQTEPEDLYDFRVLNDVMLDPGAARQVSARTIQGFTSYVLSLYQEHGYAGIYVYVPKSAMVAANQLKDDVLLVEVLEAPVTTVTVSSYDADQNVKEKGYLRQSVVEEWSPVQPGGVASEKELNDFVNLLNQNPDRYVSATVTKGEKPNTLAVDYDIYEANPWHWFLQVDNAGTRDKQWVPRVGVINTNLLGIDDTFTAIYQAPWDSDIDDEYSLFGSYDFPLMGPKLRLNLYAGYSQYDINPDAGPFDFIGNGHFYGAELRYNVLQTDAGCPIGRGWFFDIKGMAERVRSKLTPSLFPTLLSSDIRFSVWGWGLEMHRRTDMSNSSIGLERWKKFGSDYNKANFMRARTAANYEFDWYDLTARHSQYMDPNKVHRVSGSVRWIGTQSRLVPAKMTSFGGMYSVRGYDEFEIVADGGLLTSLQYEYDLVAADKAAMTAEEREQMRQQEKNPYEIKKAAPLCFLDYGRTTVNHPVPGLGERRHVHLLSIGIGALVEMGDHLSGAVYYGHPLKATDDTREGKGRVNASFMLRW
jgi:hemolysin activation/secretion protein